MVQTLMKERREKVEEIKKKTNYYSTLNLIQRYDETSPATPLQARVNPGQLLPVTPQQQQPFSNNISTNGKAVNPALQAQLSRAFDPSFLLFCLKVNRHFFTSIATNGKAVDPALQAQLSRASILLSCLSQG